MAQIRDGIGNDIRVKQFQDLSMLDRWLEWTGYQVTSLSNISRYT